MKRPTELPGLDLPAHPRPKRVVRRPATPSGWAKKGHRVERELTALHAALGVRAERVPLSGALASRLGPEYGGDLKLWIWGCAAAPATAEVKARSEGGGFKTLERWLADHDALILKRNGLPPMILLPWRTWARLVKGGRA
jgi:hypothetical protein